MIKHEKILEESKPPIQNIPFIENPFYKSSSLQNQNIEFSLHTSDEIIGKTAELLSIITGGSCSYNTLVYFFVEQVHFSWRVLAFKSFSNSSISSLY